MDVDAAVSVIGPRKRPFRMRIGMAARLFLALPVVFSSSLCAHPPARGLVSWEDVSTRPVPAGARRLAYGAGTLRFGDLRMPTGPGPFPVAIVIHGGCWRAENDLRHITHLADALTRAGVATWVIEYRRIGDAGGGWTGTFADVADGTDHVRELAAQFPLDLDRVALVGHSAGGHLALWTAARHNLSAGSPLAPAQPLALRGVVSLAGITDLRTFSTGSAYCNASVPLLLGGTVDEVPERYAQASPIELVPLRIPQRLLHGTSDPHVPVEQSRGFATKARGPGEDVELIVLSGVGHFDLIAPWSKAWPTVERTVLRLLAAKP